MALLSFISLSAAAMLNIGAIQAADTPASPLDIVEAAPDEVWLKIDPENSLYMELPSGPMVIEMRPDLAPQHVERVKLLTRDGFYDGVAFHRVIEGFMAQGGDPTGTGQGGSVLPDIAGEFAKEAKAVSTAHIIGRDDRAAQVGFVGSVPVATQAPTLTSFLARETYALWGMHCRGVLSMARAGDPNSANSQFFVMFADRRDQLDQGYTVWGRVVDGYRNARRINRGEPPTRPTPIVRMRVLSDVPADERPVVEILDPGSESFNAYLLSRRLMTDDGYVSDVCAINLPARVDGEIKL